MVRACSASAGAVTVFTYVLTSPRGPRGIRWLGAGLSCSAEGPRGRGAEGPRGRGAEGPRGRRAEGPRGRVPSWRTHHGSLGLKDLLTLCSILSVAIGIPGNATPKRLKNLRSGWSAEVEGELVGVDAAQGVLVAGDPLRQHGLAGRGPIGVRPPARRAVSLAALGDALGTAAGVDCQQHGHGPTGWRGPAYAMLLDGFGA